MLLSYKKPVQSSSAIDSYSAQNVTDENVKTFWLAENAGNQQWLQIDLEKPSSVHAIQVNYHDYKSNLYGRIEGLYHRYFVEGSVDGTNWITLVDRKNSYLDVPNDYVELETARNVQFIRYRNIHVPTPHLAISGLRVFGRGMGKQPEGVNNSRWKDRQTEGTQS